MCFKVRRKEILFKDVKNAFSLSLSQNFLPFLRFRFFLSLSFSPSFCIQKSRTIFLGSLSSSSCFPLLSKFFSRALPSFFVLSLLPLPLSLSKTERKRRRDREWKEKEREGERERVEGERKRRRERVEGVSLSHHSSYSSSCVSLSDYC